MTIENQEYYTRLRERVCMTTEATYSWSQQEWRQWWEDGIDLWFSAYPFHERHKAFAPVYASGREEEVDQPIREYMWRAPQQAKEAVQQAAIDLLRSAEFASSCGAALMLGTFEGGKTFEAVHAILNAAQNGQYQINGNLLSMICYNIQDHTTQEQTASISAIIEPLLRQQENFRPILSYCLRLHDDNRDDCKEKFCALFSHSSDKNSDDIWRVVTESLNRHFKDSGSGYRRQAKHRPSA